MKRLAIIDHTNHCLYIEDVNEEILEGQYGGDEQMYIDDNYSATDYSWNWITEIQYFTEFEKTPVEINTKDFTDE